MSTIRLGAARAGRHSVIGEDTSDQGDAKHLGLLVSSDDDLYRDKKVDVFEMSLQLRPDGSMQAHTVGYLDDLTDVEREKIDCWLASLRTRKVACHYVVRPGWEDGVVDPGTRRSQELRFSCAGLVVCCYKKCVGVQLVIKETDPGFPATGYELLARIWPQHLPPTPRKDLMQRFGFDVEGPWKVLLPGHVLHALAKARGAMPHAPRRTDWRYP